MIDALILFSIKNKLIIGIFVLGLIGWGVFSLSKLSIDAVPDITDNQVQIITQSPSLAPQEIEKFITAPIEQSLVNIPKLEEIRSISNFGLSVITIVFEEDADIYTSRQLVAENLKKVETNIPVEMGRPELMPITTGLGEIFQYVIRVKDAAKNKYSIMDLRTIQDWIIKKQLSGTKGVVEVSSFGGYQKQYEISIDPEKLRGAGLTIQDVFAAIENNNNNAGGGYIEKKQNAYFIRAEGIIKSIDDIENISIINRNNIPVLIKNVTEVKFGHPVRYGAMTEDGKGEVVGGIVMMLKGANSANVIKEVKKKVEKINKSLPEGLVIEPFLDRTKLVDTAINTVTKNLVEGGLIVIFVLILLLGNLRAGLVVASVIPLSLLFAISLMNIFGVSANLMSLGAIDFGLIVDGAVIIVESVIFHLSTKLLNNFKTENKNGLNQEEMDLEVYNSTSKIRHSAAFGEIIILMVYLPILALVGIEGKMFRPMAQTVIFAIIGALILSLTYVPMASALFLSKNISHRQTTADKIISFLYKKYEPLLLKSLKNKWLVIIIAAVFFTGSIFLFLRLGGEFIPTLNEGDFAVDTRVMTGSSLQQSIETSLKAQKILKNEFPDEIIKVVSKIGNSEVPTDPMTIEASDMMVVLKEKSEWKKAGSMEELAQKMSEALENIPSVNFDFQQPIQMRFNELMTGVKSDIAIKIYGDNLDILAEKANEVGKIARKIKGVADVKIEKISGLQQMFIKYDRKKMAQYGVDVSQLNRIVRTSFAGEKAGIVFEGEKRFDVVVRLDSNHRTDIENIKNLYVGLPNHNQTPLSTLADISYQQAPMQISRDNAKRRITIGINARGRDVESIVNEIKNKIEPKVRLAPGYYFTYGGQFENLQKAKERLSLAVPISLLIIFILLYFTFNSFKESILIFSAIPLSAIGGIIALWARDMPFSVSAGVGFIALFGVAVLNGIVLMAQFNNLEKEGIMLLNERILMATKIRFRPIMMTAFVASLGFLPMALSNSSGAEVQKPLATVVIGGLVSATLLTLIVLPVLYSLFVKKTREENSNSTLGAFKKNKLLITFLISFLFGLTSMESHAQEKISLKQAIDLAINQNSLIKISNYEIKQQQSLSKSSYDLPKTTFDFQYGQTQAVQNDYTFNVAQGMAFPSYYSAQKKLAQSNINLSVQKAGIQKNELTHQIRYYYYQLNNLHDLALLLQKQDSIYKILSKAAEIKYKTGETNELEKISSTARLYEIINRQNSVLAEIKNINFQLNQLVNGSRALEFELIKNAKIDTSFLKDSLLISQNPVLNYLKSQTEVTGNIISVEKNRALPDFRLGYFNQSIMNVKNYQGVIAGISIPLFFKWYQGRVQAANINNIIAQENLTYQQNLLQTELRALLNQHAKNVASLKYYEGMALPQAEAILYNALKSYRLGDIDYTSFVQNTLQAWQIKENYLNNILSYNQVLINIQFVLGI